MYPASVIDSNPDEASSDPRLLYGNILRQRFEFVVSQRVGNPVHYGVRTVGAEAAPEINELSTNVILVLAANHWEH